MFPRLTFAIAGAVAVFSVSVQAETAVKIGLITTLSGADAALGRDVVDGFHIGLRHAGGGLGGEPGEIVVSDDKGRADFGRAHVERAVQRDRIDILTGIVSPGVLAAAVDTLLRERREVFLINVAPGPAPLAGRKCHPNLFSVAAQNEAPHETMGRHLSSVGLKRIFLMAPNTPEGKDALSAFRRHYRGEISAEVYTRPGKTDFSIELAALREISPDAVYAFYSGAAGAAFMSQHAEAGLVARIPLFGPSHMLDQRVLGGLYNKDVRAYGSAPWSERLSNPANETFVHDFEASYGRLPGTYAAQAYDAARLIDAALRQAGGIANRTRFRDALRNADFPSLRGQFKFNRNQFPVETHYLTQVAADERGRLVNFVRGVILASHADTYAGDCRMKW